MTMSRSSEPPGKRRAVHDLQPLGIVERRRQAARDVHGDVLAADRDGVGMDELAVGEDRDRGGAAAHVDAGAPSSTSSSTSAASPLA